VGEPFGVFQHHDGAIDLGKVRERAREYQSRFGAKRTAFDRRRPVFDRTGVCIRPVETQRIVGESHRIATLFAQPHERLVHADSMKPCAEGRLGAKRRDLLESLEQAFLQYILRVGVAADHSQEHSVEASFVRSHQGLERADVASPRRCDQRDLVS